MESGVAESSDSPRGSRSPEACAPWDQVSASGPQTKRLAGDRPCIFFANCVPVLQSSNVPVSPMFPVHWNTATLDYWNTVGFKDQYLTQFPCYIVGFKDQYLTQVPCYIVGFKDQYLTQFPCYIVGFKDQYLTQFPC